MEHKTRQIVIEALAPSTKGVMFKDELNNNLNTWKTVVGKAADYFDGLVKGPAEIGEDSKGKIIFIKQEKSSQSTPEAQQSEPGPESSSQYPKSDTTQHVVSSDLSDDELRQVLNTAAEQHGSFASQPTYYDTGKVDEESYKIYKWAIVVYCKF